MDPLARRIPGSFQPHGLGAPSRVSVLPGPYLVADVNLAGEAIEVPFLFDTGADFTTLNPQDMIRIWGRRYLDMDFASDADIQLAGIGEQTAVGQFHEATLTFLDSERQPLAIPMTVVIAQPTPATPGLHGNWQIPSLLGRDILAHFDLELSYNPPSVTLTETAPN